MEKVRKNLQELSSKVLGAVMGGMDLSGTKPSTNFEEHVLVGSTVYVYDYRGQLIRTYELRSSGGGTGGGGGGGW